MNRAPYRLRLVGGAFSGHSMSLAHLPNHVALKDKNREVNYFLVRLRYRRGVYVEEVLCRQIVAWQEINRQIALRIIADHHEYIACDICHRVFPRVTVGPICPLCHGYRFVSGIEEISAVVDAFAELEPAWLRYSFFP